MTAFDRRIAQQVLERQPFSSYMGAELTEFGDGRASLRVSLTPDLWQQNGLSHGGAIAYCVDNTIAFAVGSVLGEAVGTRGIVVEYLAPAIGAALRAQASVLHSSKRTATCRCEVFATDENGEERLCAVEQGTVQSIRSPR